MDGIPHFGLPIFKENKILYTNTSVGERELQGYALLMAKIFSEFVR